MKDCMFSQIGTRENIHSHHSDFFQQCTGSPDRVRQGKEIKEYLFAEDVMS